MGLKKVLQGLFSMAEDTDGVGVTEATRENQRKESGAHFNWCIERTRHGINIMNDKTVWDYEEYKNHGALYGGCYDMKACAKYNKKYLAHKNTALQRKWGGIKR